MDCVVFNAVFEPDGGRLQNVDINTILHVIVITDFRLKHHGFFYNVWVHACCTNLNVRMFKYSNGLNGKQAVNKLCN